MLGDFEEYLIRKAFIKDKYIPFYTKWVSYCYSFLDQPNNCLLTSEQIKSYLNYISKSREDWQITQAETALRLYGYYLASAQEKPPNAAKNDTSETQDFWMVLENDIRAALRLRHRSYSTEKTYVGWLWAFGDYVGKKSPSELMRQKSANRAHPKGKFFTSARAILAGFQNSPKTGSDMLKSFTLRVACSTKFSKGPHIKQ